MSNHLTSSEEQTKEYADRFRLLYGTLAATALLFSAGLWYLQIQSGEEYRSFSEKNRIKETEIPAPRGLLYDRDGKILVENLPGFEAVISPQYTEDLLATSKAVAEALQMDAESIKIKVDKSRRQNGPFFPVRIKENLTRDEVFRLKRLRLNHPGLDIREAILRSYPLGEDGAQLFGYVGEISKNQLPIFNTKYKGKLKFKQGDIIGKAGLEEVLEPDLRGHAGVSFLQVDAKGREAVTQTSNIYGEIFKDQDAIPGNNIVLTLDKDVQQAAYDSFKANNRIGALVALKANGEVLAWLSSPSYDPKEFAAGIAPDVWSRLINDPYRPLRNKVIQDHAAPGSTFKPIIALAALQENVVTPTTVIYCPGAIKFGRRMYHDHLKGGHGRVTIIDAIERSSNVFFYRMGIGLGIEHMSAYAKAVGIGSKTNIELNQEVSGLMPSAEWKKENIGEPWQPGENLSTAIGQGFVAVTPIQMALAYLTIGLEGKRFKPFVIKKILSHDNQRVLKEVEPVLLDDLTQPKAGRPQVDISTFQSVKQGLWRVANGVSGTARWWKIPGVEMAGKTGTSQVMSFSADQIYEECTKKPIQQRHHGWYIGMAPAANPEIVVAILAEHACHGSTGGAPIARDVIKAYMQKYHPEMLKNVEKSKLAHAQPSATENPDSQSRAE